jgi:type II secretory pathway pseudopilin PulG
MSFDRANKADQALSIIELLVYMAISSVVLTVIIMLFNASGRSYDKAAQSYILTEQALSGYRTLQTDLRETSLSSIVLEEDGFTMISARSLDDPGRFVISRYGVPEWSSYIRYRFGPEGDKKNHYKLGREIITPSKAPIVPLPYNTSITGEVQKQRVVINGLLPPGKSVQQKERRYELVDAADSPGGARLSFLRTNSIGELTTSQVHPADGNPKGNTQMVKIELKFFGYSEETGHLDYAEVELVVTPRN